MPSVYWIALAAAGTALASVAVFLLYIYVRYAPIVGRIFEEKPLLLPLRLAPAADAEEVRFPTTDGLTLAGSYLRHRAASRLGVIVFCHEYLGDRASAQAYLGHLRDLGFDLFSFDFRNHGASDADPSYNHIQWVTAHELSDLRSALRYLRGRPDADPAGVGLFGVSRGGSAALCVGGKAPEVWGVATDGAFPTRGMMLAYILRWADIYVGIESFWRHLPIQVYQFLAWSARKRSQARMNCRFPDVERATARLAPRPLLMIHGAKDAYIGPKIAEGLFAVAGEPKELWLVPGAKHNRCREVAKDEYLARVASFFLRNAPRASRPAPSPTAAEPRAIGPIVEVPEIAAITPTTTAANLLSH